MAIVSADDLRRSILDGIQYVLDRPVRYWVTQEQKRVLKAQESFWQNATPAVMQDLFERYRQATTSSQSADVSSEPDYAE
jgi:hypothetical protein